jgi:ABC-2 type transport system permease protein
MTEHRGELFDLGYRHYDGPRLGRMGAARALWTNGIRNALGLGRGSRAKILPGLLFLAVMIPALVFTLVATATGPGENLPGHSDYYLIVSMILLIFSAIMAPELLCPDRRDRVIDLYLVRPLTRTDYVVARWAAFFTITLALVYLGQIVLLVGYTFAAAEPLEYLRSHWLDIPRFLAAGVVIAVFTTTLPMAVAAFTPRRAYAAIIVIGLFLISSSIASALTQCDASDMDRSTAGDGAVQRCEPLTGGMAKWLALMDIGQVPIHVSDLIFNEAGTSGMERDDLTRELPQGIPVAWYLALTIVPGFVLWRRYQRIQI